MRMFKKLYRSVNRGLLWLPEWARLALMGLVALGFFVVGATIAWAAFMPIPSIENFESRAIAESTKIFDRTGDIVLYDVHGSVRRTSVPLDRISPYIQKATIAIEDTEFYDHFGFRPLAFARAVWTNLTTGDLLGGQGGSTITQQVVKNALLTQDKTVTRKLKEIILAVRLERLYTKDEILTAYLNESPYGGTIYGVQEASQYFFGVDAADVTLAQAAYLAALPQRPTYFSPHGNHRDALDARKNLVLKRMKDVGFITEEEYDEAIGEIVQFKDEAEAGIKAPHFVFYIREYLEEKYGVDEVMSGGLRVVTTLDYDLQAKAEETIAKYAPSMQANFNATNEGIVAIEPATGQILAMVGSRGYFDDTIDGKVNVTISHRQPGSSFKPLVYAALFEKGYTTETVLFDVPTQFSTTCGPNNLSNEAPCYAPGNYDDKFRGPMTVRDALAQSINIPAVKALYLVGVPEAMARATAWGITTLDDASRFGLSLVLGGGEVTLLDLTSVYSVFANEGVRNEPTGILRVEDRSGRVLESYENNGDRVMDPEIARMVNDVLSDNEARTPGYGANSPLVFPGHDVAAKTGTTNDYRDVWIIGHTPGVAVGAWAGNNDNSPMVRRVASFIIAPMWHDFVAYAIEKYPAGDFIEPAPDPEWDSLPPVLRGEWNGFPGEGVHEILHWVRKDNPRAGRPTNPASDPQYYLWEAPVQAWVSGQLQPGQGQSFTILSPQPGQFAALNAPVSVTGFHPYPQNVVQVTYLVNGAPIGTAAQPPYAVTFVPTVAGPLTLHALVQTTTGMETTQITFNVQ